MLFLGNYLGSVWVFEESGVARSLAESPLLIVTGAVCWETKYAS